MPVPLSQKGKHRIFRAGANKAAQKGGLDSEVFEVVRIASANNSKNLWDQVTYLKEAIGQQNRRR